MSVVGVIARCDDTGLGNQSRALVKMLKPDRILVIDSTPFTNHYDQHFEWYDGFMVQQTRGWPTNLDVARFMRGLTHVISAETVYNPKVYEIARLHKTKVFTQLNWEFLDHLKDPRMPQPYKWLMPSYWFLDEMKQRFPNTVYLPPPIVISEFKDSRMKNLNHTGRRRFLHIMGKVATHDRNGTYDLLDALKYSTSDFELVIRSQYGVPEYIEATKDPRVSFEMGNIPDQTSMYGGFDAMIMPRRYGGLCLPMNEALACALPVIMTDISPNNKALPENWLVPATKTHDFMARTKIDVYRSDIIKLGKKLDWLAEVDDDTMNNLKLEAYEIAIDNYSSEVLKPQYQKVMEL